MWLGCALLAAVMMVGCGGKEKTTTEKEAEKTVQEKAPGAVEAAEGAAKDVSEDAEAAAKDAEGVLAKILALIKEQNWAEAEKLLKTLEAKKGSFPKDLQDRIVAARASVDAGKAAKGLNLPKL
ncbi:MAG: hypothetical protein AMJ81_08115 [Phycisphaerae bacterium SM23_33]|nr:MAG: hypothetical protein AMJ81_08115 [Phycisphaerae bacterium SM23_33]